MMIVSVGVWAATQIFRLRRLVAEKDKQYARSRRSSEPASNNDDDDVPLLVLEDRSDSAVAGSSSAGAGAGGMQKAKKSYRDRLRSSLFRSAAEAGSMSYRLGFVHLNYWVQIADVNSKRFSQIRAKKKYKQLLHDMSGIFEPGRLTAIMGGSGTGKTTLLNLISGRAKAGEFAGLRTINGQPMSLSEYREMLSQQGYVIQQDRFLEALTIRQCLTFEALLRIPDTIDMSEKLDRVNVLLSEVGLEQAADNKIGGITFTGISGGQRRRLSIAIELLRLPAILLLDEPTSGLDSTSALKLIELLAVLARGNRTIVTTIHQPRAEIIELFDDLLLLGEGGHVIYNGPASEAKSYLESSGIDLDASNYDNPGDFIIDAIGLDPEATSLNTRPTVDLAAYVWPGPRD